MPVIGEAYIAGRFPKELVPGMAELGLLGANLPEERLRRTEQRGLRAHHAGAGAGRQRNPVFASVQARW
jgi:hypothetical protein